MPLERCRPQGWQTDALSLTSLQAIKVVNMIKVFGKPIRVNKASQEKRALDVGANLFIGNLDPDVDEKMLYDTFSAFGVIAGTPKIMRDPDSGTHLILHTCLGLLRCQRGAKPRGSEACQTT